MIQYILRRITVKEIEFEFVQGGCSAEVYSATGIGFFRRQRDELHVFDADKDCLDPRKKNRQDGSRESCAQLFLRDAVLFLGEAIISSYDLYIGFASVQSRNPTKSPCTAT
jgi:hypothetical protein